MIDIVLQRETADTSRPDAGMLTPRLEAHRVELSGHCYRMLGSAFEAEDAVQETFLRGWRGIDRFEGRSAFRSWLYRIATNVCLTMLEAPQRRARPMDLAPASTAGEVLGPVLPGNVWVEPIPDGRAVPSGGDPADVAVARESIRLAFVAAAVIQIARDAFVDGCRLPPRSARPSPWLSRCWPSRCCVTFGPVPRRRRS